tara:strand:- start:168 stop:398 length:231 start_codon:yes stop_codon:yes gene_type:complete
MFIGRSPEGCGKEHSEIWQCHSCEKFILVETIQDWKNAKVMKREDFEGRTLVDQPDPLLTDIIKENGFDFQHHSGI